MPFTFLIYATRKVGTSPADFKSYYENIHMPLVKALAGSTFPNKHVRRYLQRPEKPISETGGNDNSNYPATVLVGPSESFTYDAIAELEFDDEAAFHTFMGVISQEEVAAKLAADEESFLDRKSMTVVVLGDINVTVRD